MTRETARRAGQALLWWGVVGGPILAWWPGALRLPALWAVVVLGVLANVLQPSYRLRDPARSPEDRGTFRQIMLTVYGSQAAALVELVLRRPAGLPIDSLGAGALLGMSAGLALRTWAIATLGGWFTLRVGVKPAQRLVQEGPYRRMRHPSYAGAFLAFVASAILLHAWVAAALARWRSMRPSGAGSTTRSRCWRRACPATVPTWRGPVRFCRVWDPGPPGGRRRPGGDCGVASPGSGRPPGGPWLPA